MNTLNQLKTKIQSQNPNMTDQLLDLLYEYFTQRQETVRNRAPNYTPSVTGRQCNKSSTVPTAAYTPELKCNCPCCNHTIQPAKDFNIAPVSK